MSIKHKNITKSKKNSSSKKVTQGGGQHIESKKINKSVKTRRYEILYPDSHPKLSKKQKLFGVVNNFLSKFSKTRRNAINASRKAIDNQIRLKKWTDDARSDTYYE